MAIYTPMQREVMHAARHRSVTLIEFRQVGRTQFVQPTKTYQKGRVIREFPSRA